MNWRNPSSINLPTSNVLGALPVRWRPSQPYGPKIKRAQSVEVPEAHYSSAISTVMTASRNFIDHDLVGNSAQRRVLLNGGNRLSVQHRGHGRRVDHRSGNMD